MYCFCQRRVWRCSTGLQLHLLKLIQSLTFLFGCRHYFTAIYLKQQIFLFIKCHRLNNQMDKTGIFNPTNCLWRRSLYQMRKTLDSDSSKTKTTVWHAGVMKRWFYTVIIAPNNYISMLHLLPLSACFCVVSSQHEGQKQLRASCIIYYLSIIYLMLWTLNFVEGPCVKVYFSDLSPVITVLVFFNFVGSSDKLYTQPWLMYHYSCGEHTHTHTHTHTHISSNLKLCVYVSTFILLIACFGQLC